MLQTLTDELSSVVSEYEEQLSMIGPHALSDFQRELLAAVTTIGRARAKQPDAIAAASWREFAPVQGAARILWLERRPLKPSEIIPKLLARGWRSSSTRTPNATLTAQLEHAKLYVQGAGNQRWTLTPAGDLLERARVLSEVDRRYPNVSDVLRQFALRRPPKKRV